MTDKQDSNKKGWDKITKYALLTRWFQEKDLDVLNISSSFKGFGKSSYSINQAYEYVRQFGLTCLNPKCGYDWITTKKVLNKGALKAIQNENKQINVRNAEGDLLKKLNIKLDVKQPCPKCKSKLVKKTDNVNFEKYLAYDNEEIEDMIYEKLPEYSPIIGDEAVNFMMGEDWNKKESKRLKKLFAVMRTKHLVVFANIPRFKWLDSKYREDMATFWLRIIKRGLGVMSVPDLGETEDAWHLKYFQELLGSYNFFTPDSVIKNRIYKLKYKHPSVLDVVDLPMVPDKIYEEYLKIRNKKAFERRDKDNDKVKQKDYAKFFVHNLLENWDEFSKEVSQSRLGKPTTKIIASKLLKGFDKTDLVSYSTVSNWNNEVKKLKRS